MTTPQTQNFSQTIQATEVKSNLTERQIFNTVLVHCLLIIFSPIVTFFIFNFLVLNSFGVDPMTNNIYSAFAAVVVLHIALGNFIYRAYIHSEAVPGFDKLDKED